MALWLPTGSSWRECWEAKHISGVNWRSSIPDGKLLTMTNCIAGYEKRSTSRGVRFVVNSDIDCGVIHNAAAKLWISFKFTPDITINAASLAAGGDEWFFSKQIDGNNYLTLRFESSDGKMYWRLKTLTVDRFEIMTTQAEWTAGVTYHVLASISDTGGIGRLTIDDGTPVLTGDLNAAPNGANFVIANNGVGGAGGLTSVVISDFFVGTDDLTDAEETDLYNGIPPADAVNVWKLNEGSGLVAVDDGSGGNNGALDVDCTWVWDGVQEPVASFAGIDQRGVSAAGIDLTGNLSIVWVGKLKSTYDAGLSGTYYHYHIMVDNDNEFWLRSVTGSDGYHMWCEGGATGINMTYAVAQVIDNYSIIITTNNGGNVALYTNGVLRDSDSGVGALLGGVATAYLGTSSAAASFDVSEPLIFGVVEGALNAEQVRIWAKHISDRLGLGVI